MTDANKYYIDKREAEQEEYDFKDEYEEIAADNMRLEARIEELEVTNEELEEKLKEEREAVDALSSAFGCECKGKVECVLAQTKSDYPLRKRADEAEAKLANVTRELNEALNQLHSARHSVVVLEERVAELKGKQDD